MTLAKESTLEKKRNGFHFDWILPVFFKPRKIMPQITSAEKPVWLTPLLLVSVLILLSALVAAPITRNAVMLGMNTPENFQYYSEGQQAAFASGQASRTSPLFLYIFPVLTGLAGLWASWFILGSLLHLSLTLAGGRSKNVQSFNLAGWSFLPIALRFVIQIAAMLITQNTISSQGLSGFVSTDAGGFMVFLAALLGLIDLYFIWQVLLLFMGAALLSGLAKGKAWIATGISVVILVLMKCLPGILSHALSGLSGATPFYF